MSTVGFGDISTKTYFGRSFIILFISIGLVNSILVLLCLTRFDLQYSFMLKNDIHLILSLL